MAAKDSKRRREQLSEATPENKTVMEKSEVNKTPDSSPYLLAVKLGMATDIM